MNENLKAFLQKASEDEALKARIAEVNASVMSDAKAKFVKLAEEHGYIFTEADLEPDVPAREKLSEDELNAAAGGRYSKQTKSGKEYSDCVCAISGMGESDWAQKICFCALGGCGELTANGKEWAEKGEINWVGNKNAKVAMWCAVGGSGK